MNCCAECFGDRGLRRNIIPLRSTANGLCSYCGSDNVAVLEPAELSEYFELLVSAYRHAIATTFLTGAGVAALAFTIVLFLPERPLRAAPPAEEASPPKEPSEAATF